MSIEYRLTEKIPAEDFLDGRLERHGVIHTMQDRRIFNAIGPSRYGRPVIYRPTEECDFGGFYVLVEKPPTGFSCSQEEPVMYARIDDDGTVESLWGSDTIDEDVPVLRGLQKAFNVKIEVVDVSDPDPWPLTPFERWLAKSAKYRERRPKDRLL